MNDKKSFRISVRDLVEICLRHGSLSRNYVSRERAREGIFEHSRIQKARPETYQKEVPVSITITEKGISLEVFGRIDGILISPDGVVIEEIKTCLQDPAILAVAPKAIHMAQLKCYGYMYLKANDLPKASLQITYSNIQSNEICHQQTEHTVEDLEHFFRELTCQYIEILSHQTSWIQTRNRSIIDMPFAYDDFRPNQRPLSVAVYRTITRQGILLAKAPTGTGKTIATLFPAIKSLGFNQTEKIFYLTARTIGRTVAEKAIRDMREKGLRLKSITLTAKQKICFVSNDSCDMETCVYAGNYYGKLNHAMSDALSHDEFDRDFIEKISLKHMICPFEFSLDLSCSCDVIICDLNYVFDPRVYLKRFFDDNKSNFTFLIDEAHNLPDRLRSMYSAGLHKSDILETRRMIKDHAPGLAGSLSRINTLMLEWRKQCDQHHTDFFSDKNLPQAFVTVLQKFYADADFWLDTHPESAVKDIVLDVFFSFHTFLVIAEYFDHHYRFYIEKKDTDLTVNLFCIDPSSIFTDLTKKQGAWILFSATFYPFEYYKSILFKPDILPECIMLTSPFPVQNLNPLIYATIKTTYKDRPMSMGALAEMIHTVTDFKKGNYLVFFPSYVYMNQIIDIMNEKYTMPSMIVQQPSMTEPEKEIFLNQFGYDSQTIGFAVMGGMFSEGIDLDGDRLIGVIVVSVGIPQICSERDLIKSYYDQQSTDGFFHAYQMPGFSRVLQAAGRLIRTESDKGVVILVDERFCRTDYKRLLPPEYHHYQIVHTIDVLKTHLEKFWKD